MKLETYGNEEYPKTIGEAISCQHRNLIRNLDDDFICFHCGSIAWKITIPGREHGRTAKE